MEASAEAVAHRSAASAQAAAVLQRRNAQVAHHARTIEHELERANRRNEALQDEVEALRVELSARPSVRAWRTSQHCVKELEHKLAAATEAARMVADSNELRKYMSTRSLIEKDKLNAKVLHSFRLLLTPTATTTHQQQTD